VAAFQVLRDTPVAPVRLRHASAGPLAIVGDVPGAQHVGLGVVRRQRRHHDAVGKPRPSDVERAPDVTMWARRCCQSQAAPRGGRWYHSTSPAGDPARAHSRTPREHVARAQCCRSLVAVDTRMKYRRAWSRRPAVSSRPLRGFRPARRDPWPTAPGRRPL
jgi:hypothetical protein